MLHYSFHGSAPEEFQYLMWQIVIKLAARKDIEAYSVKFIRCERWEMTSQGGSHSWYEVEYARFVNPISRFFRLIAGNTEKSVGSRQKEIVEYSEMNGGSYQESSFP